MMNEITQPNHTETINQKKAHLTQFRNLATLSDGTRALLRPLTANDQAALAEFFARITAEDRLYLQHDITDPLLVTEWVSDTDYEMIFPLLAVIHERIVGVATLSFGSRTRRHQGELFVLLGQEVRRRGLGLQMLRALIDVARKVGLHQIVAESVIDQSHVIKAFKELNFEWQCTMPDAFMLLDGSTRDVAMLVLQLVDHRGEF